MKNDTKATIHAKGFDINVFTTLNNADFISLTDIARYRSDDPTAVIQNWMRNRDTLDFLGLWEKLNNPDFKPLEFEGFKNEAGRNAFTLSPKKWIDATAAKGIISKSGRYGGTFAHLDIALEFASWISPEFKLYMIKDYQRLKTDESYRYSLDWNVKRELARINYHIHTDAIKEHLIPTLVTAQQTNYTYANEADMLNVALFGLTAKEWRTQNPEATGNLRDNASVVQLIVLVNMENVNAQFIKQQWPQEKRMRYLNQMAIEQMRLLVQDSGARRLSDAETNRLEKEHQRC